MKLEKNTKWIFIVLGLILVYALIKNPSATIESFSLFGSQSMKINLIGIPLLVFLLIPLYGIYVSIKKSYNPFKMWGSYVVASVLPIAIIAYTNMNCDRGLCDGPGMFVLAMTSIPVGFLIGWGIHTLLIKYKILRK